ncbi:MAG: hypothetical protein V1775_08425 [Bacteroidota bacterium]
MESETAVLFQHHGKYSGIRNFIHSVGLTSPKTIKPGFPASSVKHSNILNETNTVNLSIPASTLLINPCESRPMFSLSPEAGFSGRLALFPYKGNTETTFPDNPDRLIVPDSVKGAVIHCSTGSSPDTLSIIPENKADSQHKPVVRIGQVKAKPSSIVSVPVMADNYKGIGVTGYFIDYDSSVLSFLGIDHVFPGLPDSICCNCTDPLKCCKGASGYIHCQLTNMDSSHVRLNIEIHLDSNHVTVPNGDTLFDIVFNYSEGYSDLVFAGGNACPGNSPYTGTEMINQSFENYYFNGSVGSLLSKTFILELNLEGLYNPESGIMNQASGRNFPESVADEITICLAGITFPYAVEFETDSVPLQRSGQCRFEIPGSFDQDYYIVIRHRNSIETWTKYPVSFTGDTVYYKFTDLAQKAYHNNLKAVSEKYCIYAGDVNQDGFVDSGDMTILDNESSQFITGYIPSDVNGDQITDTGDINIEDNNNYIFVSAQHPFSAVPEVITTDVSGITTESALSGGEVLNHGSSQVNTRGICWNASPDPVISDSMNIEGNGIGSFSSSITGLLPYKTYYIRAFAANNDSLVYGNQVIFNTMADLPVVTTMEVSGILPESAITGGTVTYDGGALILQRGVCWSTNPVPTLEDSITINGADTGTYISNLTGLIPYTTYYLRAYATNAAGTSYGNELVFNTPVPSELTDGNNYAHYIFDDNSNIRDGNNLLSQFRDIIQGNAAGSDIFNGSGDFESSAGWTLDAGWSVSDGKLVADATGSGIVYRSAPTSLANAVYNLQYTIDTISGSWFRNINCYPLVNRTIAGSYSQNVISENGYLGLGKQLSTKGKIDNFTAKRIAGNHLVQYNATNQPMVRSTYIQFNGNDNFLRSAVGVESIGSIYIVVQRIGTDDGFVVLNSLADIGQYVNKRLTIGANNTLTSYYNIRIKEILIRNVTDNQATQTKLNTYFGKKIMVDGWNVPPGKTSSPATNVNARQFIVTLIDDDASEGAYPQEPSAPDHPYQGGYYTRLHPVIVAANRYLLAHNLIQPGEEIAPSECVYIHNRLSTNPANVNYFERAYHLKCLQDLYGWEISNHSYTHFGYFDGQTIEDIEENAEYEINTAFDELENLYGFNVSTFVYPKGIHSHILRTKVAERHTSAFTDRGAFALVNNHNNPPLNHFAISRKTLDYILCDATGNLTNPATALNAFKSYVDSARINKGWLVTMSHSGAYFWKNHNALYPDPSYPTEWIVPVAKLPADWQNSTNHILPEGWVPYPNSLPDCLYQMIIYIYEQGGKIVLPRDGINSYGNMSTSGDVTWGVQGYKAVNDALNYEHKAVGVDGSVTSFRE